MNHQNIELRIDNYLSNKMSPEEMDAFEKELHINPELKASFQAEVVHKFAMANINAQRMQEEKNVSTSDSTTSRTKSLWQNPIMWGSAAAAIILLVWAFWPPNSNIDQQEQKYAELQKSVATILDYDAPTNYGGVMGAENDVVDSLIKNAYEKYVLGENYPAIIDAFVELRKKYPDSLEHRFFLAYTYLQAGQPEACYKLLANWPEEDTEWKIEKNYILLGAILSRHTPPKENDIEEAMPILKKLKNTNRFNEHAEELLTLIDQLNKVKN